MLAGRGGYLISSRLAGGPASLAETSSSVPGRRRSRAAPSALASGTARPPVYPGANSATVRYGRGMEIRVSKLAAQQLSRLADHYSAETRSPAGIKITVEQAADTAISAEHLRVFGEVGAPGTDAAAELARSGLPPAKGATGGADMGTYALEVQDGRGWRVLSHHATASEAETMWAARFGDDARARGRIMRVRPGEIVSPSSIDTRTDPGLAVQRLGFRK